MIKYKKYVILNKQRCIMAKLEINELNLPEFIDQRAEEKYPKASPQTTSNKISICFAIWGIILSVLNMGAIFSIVSFVMSAKYFCAKNATTSAKWAKYLSVVALIVNAVIFLIFRYFQV